MTSDKSAIPSKTAEELFLASFEGDYDDELPWDAVRTLHSGSEDEVFRLAAAYCGSEVPIHRARALDVLAQLSAGKPLSERRHFQESVSIALVHLEDGNPIVVHSAAWALAHLKGEQAVSALIRMRKCADAGVRWAVAFGMAGSTRPDAIRTLIDLMEDDDDEVRNWATFGLGSSYVAEGPGRLGILDSTDIREALRLRLNDSFSEVRDEAIWGLARRRDAIGLQLLLSRLDSEQWIAGDETAAAEVLEVKYDTPVEALRSGLRNLVGKQ